jgi:membrane protein implicated in regulation of membrane protease activity
MAQPAGTRPSSPQVLWIIHGAFIAAMPIYMALVLTVFKEPHPDWELRGIRPSVVFGALAIVSIAQALVGFTFIDRLLESASHPQPTAMDYLMRTQARLLINDAFLEAIAIYGIVGRVFGIEIWQALAFMIVSLALLALQSRRLREWLEEYERRRRRE